MKAFSEYLSEQKITAADFENFITVAFNGGPNKDKETPIKSMEAYNAAKPALNKIVNALKSEGFRGRMQQTGRARGTLNPNWMGSDTTPKADMIVGKSGISLKKKGGSQLMSAKKDETLSTFYAAVDFMNKESSEATRLANKLSKVMKEFAVPQKLGTIGDFTLKAKKDYIKTRGAERQLADDYLTKSNLFPKLTKEIREFFEDNPFFHKFFIYEAATGAYKFQPDPAAAADYIVAFDEAGNTSIHRISNGYGKPGKYINNLARDVSIRISWKTHSSRSQKTFPSFRADVRENASIKTFSEMYEDFTKELTENWFTDAAKRVMGFVGRVVSYLMELASKGISAILSFFEYQPDNISVSSVIIEDVYKNSGLGAWFGKGGKGGKSEGGWDRYNEKGERVGKCGDAPEGAAYAACLSAEKAKKLGKEGIAAFVKLKRAAQKKAGDAKKGGEEKKGQKPVFVKTGVNESENEPTNPSLWKKAIAKAKQKFDVYPSAYANAWASKWYKEQGGGWRKATKESVNECTTCEEVSYAIIREEDGKKKKVKLNDPFRTPSGPKKFAVYVKNDKGNVVLVRFGDPKMEIKRDDPERRKSFRARHGCDDPGPKWKARYWACKTWEKGKTVKDVVE